MPTKTAAKPTPTTTAALPFVLDVSKFAIAESIPKDILEAKTKQDRLPFKALFTAMAPAVGPGKNPTMFIPFKLWEGKATNLTKDNLQPKIRSQFNDWQKLDTTDLPTAKRNAIALVIAYREAGDPEVKDEDARKAGGPGFTIWLTTKDT